MCQGWRVCLANRLRWVRFPPSPLIRKVAGYGWPGRGANAVSRRGMRVRLPHLPLDALVVKRTSRLASNEEVRVRLLAGVLVGDSPVVEWPRRLPDTEEIGGSIPPGTTDGRATRFGDGPRLESERAARPCGFDSHPLRWLTVSVV